MELKGYRAPWEGELVLVCRKCTKKVRKKSRDNGLAKIRKWMKARSKEVGKDGPSFRVVGVDCLKMCPKHAVTVAVQKQLSVKGAEVFVVRSEDELEQLYAIVTE